MKFNSKSLFRSAKGLSQPAGTHGAGRSERQAGFTLIETMIGVLLLGILCISSFSAIYFNSQAAYRLADRTAILALLRGKLEGVRAASYNPPDNNFKSTTYNTTNSHSIALNKAGTAFLVTGTIITKIETNTFGHLVTVTGTFATAGKPITVQMQTEVNKFSGGQQ